MIIQNHKSENRKLLQISSSEIERKVTNIKLLGQKVCNRNVNLAFLFASGSGLEK